MTKQVIVLIPSLPEGVIQEIDENQNFQHLVEEVELMLSYGDTLRKLILHCYKCLSMKNGKIMDKCWDSYYTKILFIAVLSRYIF